MSEKPEQLHAIPSQTVGPFFHIGLSQGNVGRLWKEGAKGERIRLTFRLLDGNGAPVPDGMIELWQADAAGKYPFSGGAHQRFRFRARVAVARLHARLL